MALWTDADFVTLQAMAALDAEIASVAQNANPPIDPLAVCQNACDECGRWLLNVGQAFSGFMPPFMMPYNQTAAVIQMVGPSVNRTRFSLSQVSVSSPLPGYLSDLQRWVTYDAIWEFYREAFYRNMNDRYEKKMLMYEEQIKHKYWPRAWNVGIPIVNMPLACPGAIHEFNAGPWSQSNVTTVAGTNPNVVTQYDVSVTWVDQSKYASPSSKGNAESGPSAPITQQVPTSQVIQVSIAGLNPPNGTNPINVALGLGVVTPGNATGWNVYVAQTNAVPYVAWLQNPSPIPIATLTYTLAGAPVLSGSNILQPGQLPDSYQTLQDVIPRG